ncbi:MAG TPA: TlpA disulfide reductase family protein [Bacteroidia bacterium]|nr:TlpA disulfide reductase family protein [Bacteroidia bacterium]
MRTDQRLKNTSFPFCGIIPGIHLLLAFLFVFSGEFLISQNVLVRGKAHTSYIGKPIQLYTETDGVTHILHKEATDTIDRDGYFELYFHTGDVQQVQLKIEQAIARLYVQPDYVYGITLPELDPAYNYDNGSELELNIGIIGLDSTELNALMIDFQGLYNRFFSGDDQRFLSRPMLFKRADSLQALCDRRYRNIQNPYFKSHVIYSIASVNASASRGENILINAYILNRPILYHHKAYMDFFNACFTGYLKSASTADASRSLQHLVNTENDYQKLDAVFRSDRFLKNDSLRELVILHNLWSFYFSSDYEQEAVKRLIDQIHRLSRIDEHRKIAAHMLAFANKMLPGSAAPMFSALTPVGKAVTLNSLKGRWVYLNFFSTRNAESLREMPKIAALKKKFGDKVVFVSICVDDSIRACRDFVSSNPKYNWPIWFNGAINGKSAKELYSVSGTEAYYLISNTGYLALSPALSPSQGIEYRFNLMFKPKRKNTRTGVR